MGETLLAVSPTVPVRDSRLEYQTRPQEAQSAGASSPPIYRDQLSFHEGVRAVQPGPATIFGPRSWCPAQSIKEVHARAPSRPQAPAVQPGHAAGCAVALLIRTTLSKPQGEWQSSGAACAITCPQHRNTAGYRQKSKPAEFRPVCRVAGKRGNIVGRFPNESHLILDSL